MPKLRKIGNRTRTRSRVTTNDIPEKVTAKKGVSASGKRYGNYTKTAPYTETKKIEESTSTPVTKEVPTIPETISSMSNYSGLVMILLIALFALAFWQQYILPLWDMIWNGKPANFKYGIGPFLGAILFIVILTSLSSIAELSGMILTFVIGLWLVYLVMTKASGLTSIFSFFAKTNAPKETGAKTAPTSTTNTTTSGTTNL